MTIQWQQKAWRSSKDGKQGEKKCVKWEGKRKDGRSFRIVLIDRIGYIAFSFNGKKLGEGKSLSEAQVVCEKVPVVSTSGVKTGTMETEQSQAAAG